MRFCVWLVALAISARGAELGTGALLAATAKSQDPDFAGSVVVLIHYDSESAMGLMLNKPITVPISEIFPGEKAGMMAVYAGGPVAIGVRGLVRTKSAPFFSVITNRSELRMLLGTDPRYFRIYVGYVGWTARQLQSEVERGLWKVMPGDPKAIFDGRH